MSVPEAMLSVLAIHWPTGMRTLQPKRDGFSLLIRVDASCVRTWSRHGTALTDRLGGLLEPLRSIDAGSVLAGELVARAGVAGGWLGPLGRQVV